LSQSVKEIPQNANLQPHGCTEQCSGVDGENGFKGISV